VDELANAAQRDGAALYAATAGNPFYLAALLVAETSGVPPSVRDAVRAALARLPAMARVLAEWVSLFPGRAERGLLERLAAPPTQALEACLNSGLLQLDDHTLSFRHEIARHAIYEAMPQSRRVLGHAEIYRALAAAAPAAEPARLVHHAEAAGLADCVAALAPLAARRAASTGSHREAARLYGMALRQATSADPSGRAELLEAAAREFDLIGAGNDFMLATTQALVLRRQTHEPLRIGMNLRLLAWGHWTLHGARDEAQAAIIGAIECLSHVNTSTEHALALAQLSRLQSAWSEYAASVQSGDKALALAEVLGDERCLVEALHAAAAARMFVNDDAQALAHLQRALTMALELDLENTAAPLYRTMQMVSLIYRHHAQALEIAEQGIAYCEGHDLDMHRAHLLDNRALSQIELGRWADADASIEACLALPGLSLRLENSLRFLRARQGARRGDASTQAYWRELRAAPDAVPMGYRLPAVAAACAETAWLQGDLDAARSAAALGARVALAQSEGRLLGPVLVWLQRLGAPLPAHHFHIAPEHASELAGNVGDAATHWAEHGCVYERALALLHGEQAQVHEALRALTELGAAPAAEIARARLRAMGIRGVPRGPQPRTRDDPLGLTAREREIFELMREGLTFAVMAQRMHRSERTVEHHIAAIYQKLGVSTRAELMARHPASKAQKK
jgi:DNA-binding CsgD family transcriptional regulator